MTPEEIAYQSIKTDMSQELKIVERQLNIAVEALEYFASGGHDVIEYAKQNLVCIKKISDNNEIGKNRR